MPSLLIFYLTLEFGVERIVRLIGLIVAVAHHASNTYTLATRIFLGGLQDLHLARFRLIIDIGRAGCVLKQS